jgi:DNA-binding SARP family transcriptional activator/tetratricopeptide (TPR) repeat protein
MVALLARANSVVSTTDLVEAAWSGTPPATESAAVHTAISRLRQALADLDENGRNRIVTETHGYSIRVLEGELDADSFRELVAAARTQLAEGQPVEATATLEKALGLWRGTALPGMSGWFVDGLRARLEDSQLSAIEDLTDARLASGRVDGLVAELTELTGRYPLREKLRENLMVACYRSGRQTDALRVFQDARRELVEHLGIEPGPELRRIHQRVLAGDPDLLHDPAPRAAPTPPTAVVAVPHQLPVDVAHFVGREAELAQLDHLAEQGRDAARPPVCLVDGGAGIGKTALAVHWAHRAAAGFEGELYVNLHGFDSAASPTGSGELLDQLLRSAGVPPSAIPLGKDERESLYRTTMAGRRLLVVLDNAASAEQVRPLLPGSGSCLVIVTSRRRLSGLVARDGAVRITLGALPEDDAAALVRLIVGAVRPDIGGRPLAELVELCCRIPLALRVAAERITLRRHGTLADLVAEIDGQQTALSALTLAEDPASSLRTVFSWSYSTLDEQAGRLFRLLGLFPGKHISVPAAGALAGVDTATALRLLDALDAMHLLEEIADRRYQLHDLLRDYARERAELEVTTAEGGQALARLAYWYLHTARTAANIILPPRRPRRTIAVRDEPGVEPVRFAHYRQAVDWCEAERANLVLMIDYCAAHDLHVPATQLPAALWSFFQVRGYLTDWITTHQRALPSAHAMGSAVEGSTLTNLGSAYAEARRFDLAIRYYEDALAIATEAEDDWVIAVCKVNIGEAHRRSGRYQQAVDYYRQAMVGARQLGDTWILAFSLNSMADVFSALGDHEQAIEMFQHVLVIHRDHSDRYRESRCLKGLGEAYRGVGRYRDAERSYVEALELCQAMGNRLDAARIMHDLGTVQLELGEAAAAEAHFRSATELVDQLDDPSKDALRAELVRLPTRPALPGGNL